MFKHFCGVHTGLDNDSVSGKLYMVMSIVMMKMIQKGLLGGMWLLLLTATDIQAQSLGKSRRHETCVKAYRSGQFA